jgi:hypothetical protein
MVYVGLFRFFITSETFTAGVVIVVYFLSFPLGAAFYTKMVIRPGAQVAFAGHAFMYALGQGDGSRYTTALHFANGYFFISIYVIDHITVALGLKA